MQTLPFLNIAVLWDTWKLKNNNNNKMRSAQKKNLTRICTWIDDKMYHEPHGSYITFLSKHLFLLMKIEEYSKDVKTDNYL